MPPLSSTPDRVQAGGTPFTNRRLPSVLRMNSRRRSLLSRMVVSTPAGISAMSDDSGGRQHMIGQPDGGRFGTAEIVNAHIADQMGGGVRLTWDASALPSLVRWQLANVAGHYALGLEPCTGGAEPTSNELSFPTLQPGEARRLGVTIELLKFPSEPLARP